MENDYLIEMEDGYYRRNDWPNTGWSHEHVCTLATHFDDPMEAREEAERVLPPGTEYAIVLDPDNDW